MGNGFLSKSYGKTAPDAIETHYNDWADTYDREISANGYATPARCAAALAEFTRNKDQPVLDFGCGTGLSGLALRDVGFEVIDGLDLSAEMLERAKSTGVYRALSQIKADADLPFAKGAFQNAAAIGVIGAGAAPISVFHQLMKALPRDGKLVFSFNDHALADPDNEGAIAEWTDCGAARLLFKEYGDHLPGIDLKSNVYVIEKA